MITSSVPIPVNEKERLSALNTYQILDTLPEAEFDAITRLASYICNVPFASISFMDNDRQWFKSAVGMPLGQIPRADGFCQYTIMTDQLLEVPDTTQSDLFRDNIFVTDGLHVRFYAGAPLVDADGRCLGTLCVFDQQPRALAEEQRDALRTLATEVISHLTLRKQKRELEQSLQLHKDFYTLFNSSSEIHYIADETSKIELINNAVETILGYKPEQLIGRSLWEFVVDHDRDQFATQIETGLRTQRAFALETCVLAADKKEKCISWTAVNREGRWFASGRDITAQKAVQQQIEQLSLVASKISNGVAITDSQNRVMWINNAFESITGFNMADMQGMQMGELFGGDYLDPKVGQRISDMLLSKKAFEIELLIQHKMGKEMWLSVTNSPVLNSDGEAEKYIKVITDITDRKIAEKDLEILSFASAKSPSGVVIRDRESRVIWMNNTLEETLGYTLDELKGKVFGDILIGEYTDRSVLQKAKEAYNENKPYGIELQIYRKDGTPRWVYLSNSPFFNETGQLERQVTVCVDINDRKEAEEQVQMLSLVASNTASGVVINDADGNVEWVNKAFEKITGYALADVQGTHVGDVLRGEMTDFSIIEKARELSKNKQSFEVDLLIYRRDGQPLWISVINSVILDERGRIKKYIEVIIDITARKKAEIELINAKEEALQLSRAKEMFISVMSHEIRTPLNAVIGMAHLLAEENASESQKENLEVLKFSASNLMTLINDVLDLTKIETGNIELERASLDLRELTRSVVNSLQFNLGSKKHIYLKQHVDDAIPKHVLGDRTRLIQILLNLASNAVKFTEEGGVTIDLKMIEQSASEVRIRFAVTDTGIGIPADKIDTIFESFKQASTDTTRKYGGTGLGLAISKRLIELHDSRINVDSVVNQGSTFWFTITFKKDNNTAMTSTDTAEIGLKVNVLVVDDNQINRLLINKVLKKWGIQADFAENGLEAVQKVTANMNYDVVLMDIHMPEMGGLEATQVIRGKSDDYFKKLPIIALTASMLNNQLNQIEESGMNDFILKPFDPKNLYEKLSRYQQQ
ncbi:PAS domain S-box protein [Mucilaginibacter daejeonensis]|uniref:PAS domain S-box protein n=1 Tax=Mucilaginibacter daejeonensis TaxID=398049 RepID=UPI001D175E9A|nr:PAS domain S-box protein [Mucilaginibacter daejeonensis]UEG52949.1 PAS domain S-box protein [Mucilaginibacter daejeonensis]